MDMPSRIHVVEEGPREGFQIEKGPISTARKIELIDALSHTGLDHIQIVSFVNPKKVPGMADAEDVVAGIHPVEGVRYTGLWLNDQGFERARAAGRLDIKGSITVGASSTFLKRNQNRTIEEQIASQREMMKRYRELGVPVVRGGIMAAFGCNFEGDIPTDRVVSLFGTILAIADENDIELDFISLADTMAWATPQKIKRTIGAIRDKYPDQAISLHLHDTRGQGIANAYAGLEMGVAHFDAAVGGLGGCPFAGHAGAAGNVCTEDLIFMCQEMGIETGVDLDALVECARLAEDIVGHPLPGSVKTGGTLDALRKKAQAAVH
ncbi:MAG: hydroxymethylglutaryl-CoA lyase [Beijerinckiaceae bacterium]